MQSRKRWRGRLQLAARTAKSFASIGIDALGERFHSALPRTPEQIADPGVFNELVRRYTPPGASPLPPVQAVRLPGTQFESSNCQNFLVELEFGEVNSPWPLPRTAYVKLPCNEITTRAFANTLGFWALECAFCERVAQRVPIRVPRVYASARRGARFVLLLENLQETPGVELFLNRDMAAGTTPERAARVLRSFAEMHAAFWNWSPQERERLLPGRFNTFLAPGSREMTRALNAAAIDPAMAAAPDILSPRIRDTYQRAIAKWDTLLDAWYRGPLTLVHGDSHLGNCFEYPTSGDRRVGLIDFQATHWSKGMRDVQYFLIHSLETDVLQANESDLIDLYCDELRRHGVSLSREDAFDQYRAFSFQTLMVGVVSIGLGSLTESDTTVRAITRRSAAAVERLDFREWMDGLADL